MFYGMRNDDSQIPTLYLMSCVIKCIMTARCYLVMQQYMSRNYCLVLHTQIIFIFLHAQKDVSEIFKYFQQKLFLFKFCVILLGFFII